MACTWFGEICSCCCLARRNKFHQTTYKSYFRALYRVTKQLEQNVPLTSKQKFLFGLAWPDLDRPKRNFCLEVNGRL